MTEPTEAIKVSAGRARWRADLLAYAAAEQRRIAGDDASPVATNLHAEADRKEAEATIHLDLAEAEEAMSVAKQDRDNNPGEMSAHRRYQTAAQNLVDLRAYWRGIDEVVGNRSFVMSLDDFPEPTDEEIVEAL